MISAAGRSVTGIKKCRPQSRSGDCILAAIDAIGSNEYLESDLFTDRERAAIEWAEHVTLNTARSRDDVYERLAAQFNEAEIVEITMMSAFFNMFNRMMDSLKVDIELPSEVDRIKSSLHLDPDRVRTYLQTLLDHWPESVPPPSDD